MDCDLHIHMVLDGVYYRDAIDAHRPAPNETVIRQRLAAYRSAGITYLRDGGDAWGVSLRAKQLAPEYGIVYRSPAFPIHRQGHYGGFIGRGYAGLKQYRALIGQARQQGADFIKLMLSGLMDFHTAGKLTEEPLDAAEIKTLITIARDEGFSVMAHCNGARATLAAIEAGVGSVEHGAFLNDEVCHALAQTDTVWVPTLSTVSNLMGSGRFPDRALEEILDTATENVARTAQYGGLIGLGSDAGAYRVPHVTGARTESALLQRILGEKTEEILQRAEAAIRARF